jgi:SAM-dependent methyltransferase
MEERHRNRELYFKEQYTTLDTYILPFIEEFKPITKETQVLEIGCGYGGNLLPFLDKGCQVTGVDIREQSIEDAKRLLEIDKRDNLTLIAADIYDAKELEGKFDVIFMKDTLEHIPNQEKFIPLMKTFLKDDGVIFQGFPPWCNPFGGHQQMCESRFLSKLPWFHLTPRFMFKGIMKLFGEKDITIQGLLTDVYDTRISIQRFKRICRKNGLKIVKQDLYFINPNYEVKFKLKPRKVLPVFNIPVLRDFYTTTGYYILKKDTKDDQ